jgi:hypothetical protein
MKTKHVFLFGFAVIAIAAMFTLAGCPTEDNGGNGGGGKTIALTKEGENVLVLTLSRGEWDYPRYGTLDSLGNVAEGSLDFYQVNIAYAIQSDKRVLKATVTKRDTDGTFTYSLKDSGSIGLLLGEMIVDDFGNSDEEWTAASGKKGPVSITIGTVPGGNPGNGDTWESLLGTWKTDDGKLEYEFEGDSFFGNMVKIDGEPPYEDWVGFAMDAETVTENRISGGDASFDFALSDSNKTLTVTNFRLERKIAGVDPGPVNFNGTLKKQP